MAERKGVSLRPSDATQGGLLDDVDIDINKARFELFNYQGKGDAVPALVLHYTNAETGEEGEEALSAGRAQDWEPSEDGKSLIPTGTVETLRKSCKAMRFLTSLVNAGFDEEALADGDPSVLDGMGVHVMRVTVEYKGLEKKKDQEGKEVDFTVLEVSQINTMPGEKKSTGGKGKGKGKSAKPAPKEPEAAPTENESGSADEIDDAATQALLAVLADNDGKVQAKSIPTEVFKHLAGVKNRNAVLTRCYDEKFLAGEERPWTFEGGEVTI